MFSLTYEFKLKATSKQIETFTDWLEQCRRVYNYALAERKDWYCVGISHFVAVSNGKLFPNPRPFKKLECKLKLLQKRVSRKVKGSSNRRKAQARVSKLHERIANIRKDFYWLLAHNLCDWAGMVFAEDLNLKGLARGILGKHCLDAGWGQFFHILEQCCRKRGVFFLKVDSKKTSQICPSCLVETARKELSERIHSCEHCGYTTDRDVAAAQVVLLRGLAAVGHTVKMLSEGKAVALPVTKESACLKAAECQSHVISS